MELVFVRSRTLLPAEVGKACSLLNLQVTMKGSLKSLPDNMHWHYKLAKQPGVLEVTLMLNENKLILTCKKNRTGEWLAGAIEELKRALKLEEIA